MKYSSFAMVTAFAGSMLFSSGNAFASASCVDIPVLNQTLSAGGPASAGNNSIPNTIHLMTGDQVTINYSITSGSGSNDIGIFVSPGSVDNGSLGSTPPPSGSVSFTASASGTYQIDYVISGSGPFIVSYNGACTPATTTPPTTPNDQKSDTTDANDRVLDGGRLSNSPDELPGTNPSPPNEDLLRELFGDLNRVNNEIDSQVISLGELDKIEEDIIVNPLSRVVEIFVPINVLANAEDDTLRRTSEINAQISELEQRRTALENRIRELGGDPNIPFAPEDFTPDNPEILGDGEELLFFPRTPENSDLNNISAYNAITASTSGIQTQFTNQTELGHIWVRSKITYLDGTVGRTGYSGNVQLGFVKALMPGLDVGGFVSGFAGRVTSSTLNSNTDSQGLGVGTYLKYALTDDVKAGVSVFYERSNNNITIGPDSGSYLRDLLQVSASLSGDYQVGVINVAPRAALNWTYSDRKAYTDSASVAVPASINSQLTANTGLALSRTFLLTEGQLHSITPSVGANLNYNISNMDVLNLAGGNTIAESAFNAEIFASAQFEFINGATSNIRFGVQGLGGSTQSYSASLGINVPIH